ncbi:MAG: hypothetical protein ACYS0G_06170 [Planctomycetota bacterium]|jgi:hypothetical protein
MLLVLRRLWIQVTSDRKRFGLLCGTVLLGLLLWARIIVTSNLPRTAVAGRGPGGGLLLPDPGVSDGSDKPKRPRVRVELARFPMRDPLAISAEHFPKPTPVDELTQDQAKSDPDAAENLEQAEARLTEQLRAMVDRFELEAVMQGRPMAVINGMTYELRSWVAAVDNDQILFQLVEVGHRSVALECEGRRFELKMKLPGSEER